MEEQGSASLTEGQIAQLIKDNEIHAHHGQGNSAGFASRFLLLKRIDQIHRREEAYPFAPVTDSRDPPAL